MSVVLLQQQQAAVLPKPPTSPLLRPGQIVLLGLPSSYSTDQGTHAPFPAADIFAPLGTPIYAPDDGISRPALYQFGGYTTTIQGDGGKWFYLAHGRVPFVGGRVRLGQQISEVGSTGTGRGGYTAEGGTAPHVHFAISSDGDFSRGHRGGSGDLWPEPWMWGR